MKFKEADLNEEIIAEIIMDQQLEKYAMQDVTTYLNSSSGSGYVTVCGGQSDLIGKFNAQTHEVKAVIIDYIF